MKSTLAFARRPIDTVRMRVTLPALLLATLLGCGGDDDGDGGDPGDGIGDIDPRCASLCEEEDQSCAADVSLCEDVCQSRVAGVSSLCATCLLEGSDSGECSSGGPCCPDPDFESVLDCASSCEGESGVNPSGDHPVCVALCSHDDPVCEADASQCLAECKARIEGVSGLCATCLLEDSHSGACDGGSGDEDPCCPDPDFPTTTEDCAAVCGG
jgi:hypothetical protein